MEIKHHSKEELLVQSLNREEVGIVQVVSQHLLFFCMDVIDWFNHR